MIDARTGPERLPPLAEDAMTAEQKEAVAAVISGPRGKLLAPFVPLLRSPGLMERAQRVGEYIRYDSILPDDLRELAILVTAKHWNQPVEWSIHAPIALATGLPQRVVDQLADGSRPVGMSDAQLIVYDFCRQLHETQDVDDTVYAETLNTLGERGLVELIGLCGYYAMLAMVMNVARTPVPD